MRVRRVVSDFHVEDPGPSKAFYSEVLGLEVAMDLGWIVTFAAPGNPETQISVMREDASAPAAPDASIEVDDVDAAHAAAQRLGHEIVHPLTNEPWRAPLLRSRSRRQGPQHPQPPVMGGRTRLRP
jgi:predicted enzyme related to lactoylglutathione lyase